MAGSPTFEIELVIKEHHLDVFGHVNNAKYLELFEQARWDFVTANGYGLDVVQRLRKGPVILEAALTFKQELVNRQVVHVLSRIDSYDKKIGIMYQDILDSQNRVCCVAKFVFGLFDLDARKLIEPTLEWRKALGLT